MHLRGSGIGKAHIDPAANQRAHQTFRTVHRNLSAAAPPPVPARRTPPILPAAGHRSKGGTAERAQISPKRLALMLGVDHRAWRGDHRSARRDQVPSELRGIVHPSGTDDVNFWKSRSEFDCKYDRRRKLPQIGLLSAKKGLSRWLIILTEAK
jgi:hypothetical protein